MNPLMSQVSPDVDSMYPHRSCRCCCWWRSSSWRPAATSSLIRRHPRGRPAPPRRRPPLRPILRWGPPRPNVRSSLSSSRCCTGATCTAQVTLCTAATPPGYSPMRRFCVSTTLVSSYTLFGCCLKIGTRLAITALDLISCSGMLVHLSKEVFIKAPLDTLTQLLQLMSR